MISLAVMVLAAAHGVINFVSAADVVIDSSINTGTVTHNGTTLTVVFTSDTAGYAFYRDADGTCVFKKTADGGASWTSTSTVVDAQTDCVRVAVWYDRWTPGNTTGTLIHILTMDTSSDDLWYAQVDTTNDSVSTILNITGANQGGTFAAGANIPALTRATDGTLYAGIQDGGDSFVIRCSSSCTSSIANWTEAGTNPFDLANDWLLLMPLINGDVLATRFDISADDVDSKIWQSATGTWTGTWINVDTSCANNTTYDGHFGATQNKISKDIYLAYACDVGAIGGSDDDIRTARYNGSSWTGSADVLTNTALGLTGAKIGLDANTGNIYVVYSGRATSTIATTTNVYYKVSTSTMASWGPQQGPLNTTSTDIYGLRLDGLNDERIYATWTGTNPSELYGNTVADLSPTTYTQTSYRLFGNTNGVAVSSPFAGLNASATVTMQGIPFRLRQLILIGGDGADVNATSFKLQYATSTPGGCDTSFAGETYVDVATSTGDIRFYDNPSPSDNTALTPTSTDPVHNADTIVNQTYEESNPFTNSVAKIFGGQDGHWDFSLVDFSSAPLTTYCFRVVQENGAFLSAYETLPEIITDAVPTVGQITLNGASAIALIEGTSTLVQATATITDANGYADIAAVTAKVYRSGVTSTEACALNENNCYEDVSCVLSACSGTSCIATCGIRILYHAEPTDTGTPWESEDWRAYMKASDQRLASSTATTTSGTELLTLLGLSVTPAVNYGSFVPGGKNDPLDRAMIVTSTGNASLDVFVYGIDMTAGANTIAVGNQRYATSSRSFDSSTALLISPGARVELNMAKPRSSSTPATSTLWWGLAVPNPQPTGDYTGVDAVIAAANALPWP